MEKSYPNVTVRIDPNVTCPIGERSKHEENSFLLLLIMFIFSNAAFSDGSYDFPEALEDAETVRLYFYNAATESEAQAAFNRLYEFWYKDAQEYVLNRNTGKFHLPECTSVTSEQMKESNKVFITCSVDLLMTFGYSPCGRCHPNRK